MITVKRKTALPASMEYRVYELNPDMTNVVIRRKPDADKSHGRTRRRGGAR
jgi:hypothetical protein